MRDSPGSTMGGFSLIEAMLALLLAVAIAGAALQLFLQNERTFRDDQVTLEMHQSARAVASMIADDIMRAGQGVPVFAGDFEEVPPEATSVFLSGTTLSLLQMRIGDADAVLDDSPPVLFEVGRPRWITLQPPGSGASIGDRIFVWGPSGNTWTWVRGRVDDARGPDLLVTPTMISSEGGLLTSTPLAAREDAVSYRLSGRSILRGELRGFAPSGDPLFREMSVGDDFTRLEFAYYGSDGQSIDPAVPGARSTIDHVDVALEAETSEPLSDGRTRRYSIAFPAGPRSLEVR